MDMLVRVVFGLIAALLIAYMLYRGFWRAPSPEQGGSSGTHGGGHTEAQPDATGDPGSPPAE